MRQVSILPQGTILGPVLFSVMLNDNRPVNITKATLVVFADDLSVSAMEGGHIKIQALQTAERANC